MSCSKRNDGQSGVFEAVGIFDARKRWLMNELARPPHRGSAQPTCRSYPFVRQFGPALGEPVSPTPPELLHPSFAWCLFAGSALRMLNLVPLVAGGNIFCKGKELERR